MLDDDRTKDTEVERLQAQNRALRQQLSTLQIKNQTLWIVLTEIARRLQGHSTSIKAAVSSLLDYDIFWDESTQHEFLETIDSSVDDISALTAVLTLAFKVEARNLEIKPEPQMLQEILMTTATTLAETNGGAHLRLTMPPSGKSVLVDYEYLALALRLLFEVLFNVEGAPAQDIDVEATEAENGWQLEIKGVDDAVAALICDTFHQRTEQLIPHEQLLSEDSLRLLTACKVFQLQHVNVDRQPMGEGTSVLRLTVPYG